MTEIQLPYGRDSLDLSIDENRFQVLGKDVLQRLPLTEVEIGEALDAPIESSTLENLFRRR
jgi:hypothetical protein